MSEDKDDFSALVGDDVAPIHVEQRVQLTKAQTDVQSMDRRRQDAEQEEAKPEDPLVGEPLELLDPTAVIEFKRSGVQHGVYKNLRLGKYTIDARLDLHRLTVERARQMVYQFVRDCVANDVRTALITHGKGEGRETKALLKSHVALWLPQIDDVLAYHTAQKHHGSHGATYVLLKKSERKKQKNREQHKGRG